jgi:hypothetical protein
MNSVLGPLKLTRPVAYYRPDDANNLIRYHWTFSSDQSLP